MPISRRSSSSPAHAATTSASRSGSAGKASSEIDASARVIARLAPASQRWPLGICTSPSIPTYQVSRIANGHTAVIASHSAKLGLVPSRQRSPAGSSSMSSGPRASNMLGIATTPKSAATTIPPTRIVPDE